MTILLVLACIAIFGPMVDPTDPVAQGGLPMRHPTLDPGNWFGTTYFGEDVFAQFANGLRASFFVGFLGGGLAAVIGMGVGFVAGYRGGWLDEILNMITNIFLVIPTLAVLLVITAYLSGARRAVRGHLRRLLRRGRGPPAPFVLRRSRCGLGSSSIWPS